MLKHSKTSIISWSNLFPWKRIRVKTIAKHLWHPRDQKENTYQGSDWPDSERLRYEQKARKKY